MKNLLKCMPTMRCLPRIFLCTVLLGGLYLRVQQWASQVFIDDEWHLVHMLASKRPEEMFLDLGYADYSIPLALLAWTEGQVTTLNEVVLRWPMLVSGIAFMLLSSLFVTRKFGILVGLPFTVLMATSPMLVLYSRMGRPYAVTLLLAYVAHASYLRPGEDGTNARWALPAYVIASTLAIWLHVVILPFVIAAPASGLINALLLQRKRPAKRDVVALALVAVCAAPLVLPALLHRTEAIALKTGVDSLTWDALGGAVMHWLGTPTVLLTSIALVLIVAGIRRAWSVCKIVRTAVLGVALTMLAVAVARPQWVSNPATLARYLLPLVPVLLLFEAVGIARVSRGTSTLLNRSSIALVLTAAALTAIQVFESPTLQSLDRPNSYSLHGATYFDLRADRNLYAQRLASFPVSPFWSALAHWDPTDSTVAVGPFYFESYDWNGPSWERISGHRVIPGYVSGLCVDRRWGEPPLVPRAVFLNGVRFGSPSEVLAHDVSYVVWNLWAPPGALYDEAESKRLADCLPALKSIYGGPIYEDELLIVFKVR